MRDKKDGGWGQSKKGYGAGVLRQEGRSEQARKRDQTRQDPPENQGNNSRARTKVHSPLDPFLPSEAFKSTSPALGNDHLKQSTHPSSVSESGTPLPPCCPSSIGGSSSGSSSGFFPPPGHHPHPRFDVEAAWRDFLSGLHSSTKRYWMTFRIPCVRMSTLQPRRPTVS